MSKPTAIERLGEWLESNELNDDRPEGLREAKVAFEEIIVELEKIQKRENERVLEIEREHKRLLLDGTAFGNIIHKSMSNIRKRIWKNE